MQTFTKPVLPSATSVLVSFQYAETHQLQLPHFNIRVVDDMHLRANEPPTVPPIKSVCLPVYLILV